MNPRCVPFGMTSRQRPVRGSLTIARQFLGATRTSLISKPSWGMFACVRDESPVTVPTTWYQSFRGATAISRSQSLLGTTQPVRTLTVNACPTRGVEFPSATERRPFASATGAATAATHTATIRSLMFPLRPTRAHRSQAAMAPAAQDAHDLLLSQTPERPNGNGGSMPAVRG
jgi:hypothetical protein